MTAPAGPEPPAPGPVLAAVGPHYVIAPPGAETAGLASALAAVRDDPRALLLLVVAADAAPVLRASLDGLARAARERGAEALVLAASGLAAAGPDGRRPAALLAERCGLTVVAPDGRVCVAADGTLPAAGGTWWRCRPGTAPVPLGPHWPAPALPDGGPPPAPARPAVPEQRAVPAGRDAPGRPVRGSGTADGGPSTLAQDGAALAARLGPAYPRLVRRAADLAFRLPSLRSRAETVDPWPELVAVLLQHGDCAPLAPPAEILAAARSGTPGEHRPYLRCLSAGLRRLPSHYGGVLAAGPAEGCDPAAYVPGTVLVEPAPVAGLVVPDADLGPDTGVEFVLWSLSARRSSVFGPPDDPPAVVFVPGTRFEVLDVRPADPGAGRPPRVLLHEVGGVRPDLGRLDDWLARRDAVPPADRVRPSDPARYVLDLGAEQPTRARTALPDR